MQPSAAATNRDSAALIVWASVCLSALRISLETANRLVLWHIYGYDVVSRDHLSVVRIKPLLMVSNGDILKKWGFIHFVLGISLWLPLSVAALVVLFKYITPQWWKEQLENNGKMSPGAIGLITVLAMFVCIPGGLGFLPAMALGSTAAIFGLWWLRVSIP